MNTWTTEQPERPGWYWCQSPGDIDGEHAARIAEFICRVDWKGTELVASWLKSPIYTGTLPQSEWRTDCLWCGPIDPPTSR